MCSHLEFAEAARSCYFYNRGAVRVARALCARGLFVRQLLHEVGFPQRATKIREDNHACISQTGLRAARRTKHTDVRYRFVRAHTKAGALTLECVTTRENVADIMTKALAKDMFVWLRGRLGVVADESASTTGEEVVNETTACSHKRKQVRCRVDVYCDRRQAERKPSTAASKERSQHSSSHSDGNDQYHEQWVEHNNRLDRICQKQDAEDVARALHLERKTSHQNSGASAIGLQLKHSSARLGGRRRGEAAAPTPRPTRSVGR